jgi:hypothetical protein
MFCLNEENKECECRTQPLLIELLLYFLILDEPHTEIFLFMQPGSINIEKRLKKAVILKCSLVILIFLSLVRTDEKK